jgi:hypothetical protein
MINKVKLTLIAAIAASSIALPAAALAQSAYMTGSAASRAAAGYPSPYGYGSGLYASVPGHVYRRSAQGRSSRRFVRDALLGCGRGRVRDPQSNQCRGPADINGTSFAIRD